MEKPLTCARCGAELVQPDTGRPRVYCGPLCRRDAEYRLRRVQSHLARAERALTNARLSVAAGPTYVVKRPDVRMEFWKGEVQALSAELREALANLSADAVDEADEAPRPRLRATG